MPYKKPSKCSGLEVSEQWLEQVVTFDGRPHHYNTMNLPSWNVHDYPFVNDAKIMKSSDWQTDSSNTESTHLKMDVINHRFHSQYIHPRNFRYINGYQQYQDKAYRDKPVCLDEYNTGWGNNSTHSPLYYYLYRQASASTTVYHPKNFLHWDSNQRGAFTIKDTSNTDGPFGALIGRLKWPCPVGKWPGSDSTNRTGEWHDPQRWTSQVYGIQFEWDSGIDFNDSEVQTDSNSPGYRLEDLFLHFVCLRPGGDESDTAQTFCMPLIKDAALCKDICYWYEGYSLWDNAPWKQEGKPMEEVEDIWTSTDPNGDLGGAAGPGQGSERGNPLRRGKCGFAVDSNSKLFQLLNNGTYTVDQSDVEKDGIRHNDEKDDWPDGGLCDVGETYMYKTQIHKGDTDKRRVREWTVDSGTPNGNPRVSERGYATNDEKGESPATGHFIWTAVTLGFQRWNDSTAGRSNTFRCWNVKPITVPVTYVDPGNKYKTGTAQYLPYHHGRGEWDADKGEWSENGSPASPVVHDVLHPLGGGAQSASEQVVNGICDGENAFEATGHLRYTQGYKKTKLKERGYPYDLPEVASIPLTGGYYEITQNTVEGDGGGIPS